MPFNKHLTPSINRPALPKRRGAALMMTVLIVMIAATITTVLVRQGLASSRTSSISVANSQATQAIQSAASTLSSELAQDPLLFTNTVLPGEDNRICLTGVNLGTSYSSGASWPADCGESWGYTTGSGEVVNDATVRLRLAPPSFTNKDLTVTLTAKLGLGLVGKVLSYQPSDSGRITATSFGNLDLSTLYSGSKFTGLAYAGNDLTAGASALFSGGAILTAEHSLNSLPTSVSAYSSSASLTPPSTTTDPVIGDIRTTLPVKPSLSSLASQHDALYNLTCSTLSNDLYTDTNTGNVLSSRVCITPGATLRLLPTGSETDTTSPIVTVPADTAAVLLIPKVVSSQQVLALYTSSAISTPSTASCASGSCDLRHSSAVTSAVASGSHPGVIAHWTTRYLGNIPAPADGVVASSVDTYLGLCGSEFTGTTACSSTLTSTVASNLTIIVGSTQAPADLYLAGKINVTTGALSLGVSGETVLPYWATPSGVDLAVQAADYSLGLGHSSSTGATSAIRTEPAAMSSTARSLATNLSGSITITGSLAAPGLSLTLPTFTKTLLTADQPATTTSPGPWFPGISDNWVLESSRVAAPSELSFS